MQAMLALAVLAIQVQVIVPDAHNLQDLAFWVALGAGYFTEAGVEPKLTIPDVPSDARKLLARPDGQAAVLPPPLYLDLIAERSPWRLVANLLQNDGIDLIARRSLVEAHKISAAMPLKERLLALKGVKLGVAPGPRSRLDALFASVGLVAKEVVEIVIVTGHEQNGAFADRKVDALYAHTPVLERALVEQDAVMLVNQSAGEVAPLAARQIHALCVTEAFAKAQPRVVEKLVAAIARAEALVREQPERAVEAVLKAQPEAKPSLVKKIVELYRPAMPPTPAVSAKELPRALSLYPAGKIPPALPPDLDRFVLPQFSKSR
jgi:NitT/TauT family transport system substrate-binding protein